jgi:hypothetical protein
MGHGGASLAGGAATRAWVARGTAAWAWCRGAVRDGGVSVEQRRQRGGAVAAAWAMEREEGERG